MSEIQKTHKEKPAQEGWYWGWCVDEWLPMYYGITSIGCWFYDGIGVPEPEFWAEMVAPDDIKPKEELR